MDFLKKYSARISSWKILQGNCLFAWNFFPQLISIYQDKWVKFWKIENNDFITTKFENFPKNSNIKSFYCFMFIGKNCDSNMNGFLAKGKSRKGIPKNGRALKFQQKVFNLSNFEISLEWFMDSPWLLNFMKICDLKIEKLSRY